MMKRVKKYIESQTKPTVGLNELSADLNLTKKQATAELLQFLEDTLKTQEDGLTITDLKTITKLNRNWIAKQLEILELLGRVELKTIGPAKLYKWSEDGLNKWEKYYRALIENSHDIIVVLQKSLTDSIQLEFVSDSIERIIGFKADDLDEEKLVAHIHPDDRSVIQNLERIFSGDSTQDSINFRFLAEDNQYHHIEAAITDLRSKPEVGGLVLNCRDVTETLILQERIQYRMAFEQMMLNIATSLITTPNEELLSRLATNFELIGKFMYPMDHLQNLNLVSDYLYLSVIDPQADALKQLHSWKNPDRHLQDLDQFQTINMSKNEWLSQEILKNEPLFKKSLADVLHEAETDMIEDLRAIQDCSMLVIPFRSSEKQFNGALIIIFHSSIKQETVNHFLDLFQNLVEIVKSHLERIDQISERNLMDVIFS